MNTQADYTMLFQQQVDHYQTLLAGKRVVVGISGGVDSSVTAYLLQQAGAEVHGVFMKNWDDSQDSGFCSVQQDLNDAQSVCDHLGIPLHSVNFVAEYRSRVFDYFLTTLSQGFTPNPDVLCNKEIKFRAFLDYAQTLGADYIATGHYAIVQHEANISRLYKGQDATKDQSYFLYLLNQLQLSHALFPLGQLSKNCVRAIAQSAQLVTFNKKDSTGICFIGERDFNAFIQQYLPTQPGKMQTPEGEYIGEHQGLAFYTIGQRQGLGIGGRKNASTAPWFVVDKQLDQNLLIVAQGEHPALYANRLYADQFHWISEPPTPSMSLSAKIRYRQNDQPCRIEFDKDTSGQVTFESAQRAITPGQSIVFYHHDECLGGGIIQHKLTS